MVQDDVFFPIARDNGADLLYSPELALIMRSLFRVTPEAPDPLALLVKTDPRA